MSICTIFVPAGTGLCTSGKISWNIGAPTTRSRSHPSSVARSGPGVTKFSAPWLSGWLAGMVNSEA